MKNIKELPIIIVYSMRICLNHNRVHCERFCMDDFMHDRVLRSVVSQAECKVHVCSRSPASSDALLISHLIVITAKFNDALLVVTLQSPALCHMSITS